MKCLEILVSPDGQTRVETRGFSGGDCRTASRFLEQALGRTAGERLTPEYFETSAEGALVERHTDHRG